MEKKVEQFWRTFCKKHNLGEDTKVDAWAFGASKEEANELADLVEVLRLQQLQHFSQKMRCQVLATGILSLIGMVIPFA